MKKNKINIQVKKRKHSGLYNYRKSREAQVCFTKYNNIQEEEEESKTRIKVYW